MNTTPTIEKTHDWQNRPPHHEAPEPKDPCPNKCSNGFLLPEQFPDTKPRVPARCPECNPAKPVTTAQGDAALSGAVATARRIPRTLVIDRHDVSLFEGETPIAKLLYPVGPNGPRKDPRVNAVAWLWHEGTDLQTALVTVNTNVTVKYLDISGAVTQTVEFVPSAREMAPKLGASYGVDLEEVLRPDAQAPAVLTGPGGDFLNGWPKDHEYQEGDEPPRDTSDETLDAISASLQTRREFGQVEGEKVYPHVMTPEQHKEARRQLYDQLVDAAHSLLTAARPVRYGQEDSAIRHTIARLAQIADTVRGLRSDLIVHQGREILAPASAA